MSISLKSNTQDIISQIGVPKLTQGLPPMPLMSTLLRPRPMGNALKVIIEVLKEENTILTS